MKNIRSTNYFNTFIRVAKDTRATSGTPPKPRGNKKTVAEMQYELLINNPYKFTSDDILFRIFAERAGLAESDWVKARIDFFSKGQPCFRTSPLTKTYGFGVHSDNNGKIALFGMETEGYLIFLNDPEITKVMAMNNSKKKYQDNNRGFTH